MKFALYCKCGATWRGDIPETMATRIRQVWTETHNEPGCGPCDAATAARARAKAEREEFKEHGH